MKSLWTLGFSLILATVGRSAEIPYGHKDFLPSADRPVGFCGDGNAWFPGATPVTEWWEGTPKEISMEITERGQKKTVKVWDIAADGAKNIVWKTEMPSWANSQPIVVGDRVFTLAEPNLLVCCDANSGKILWTVEANAWECGGVEPASAAKLQAMHDIQREGLPFWPAMTSASTVYRVVPAKEWEQILPPFEQKVLPRLVAELKKLDPGTDWQGPADAMLAALKALVAQLPADKPKVDSKKLGALHDAIKKRILALGKLDVPMGLSWGHMVGSAMNAPVSDGRYVYAAFGWGQTICVDLDGRKTWSRFFADANDNRTQCQSGMLAGGVYVDVHGGSKVLRGLNKLTGETVWETPTKNAAVKGGKGGYYVGTHKIVRLEQDGKSLDVVVTTLCNIIRARDGKEVGHLPWEWDYGPSGGPSVFNVGNIVYRASNGDGGSSPFTAYRLTLVSDDEVRAEKVWDLGPRTSPGYHHQVATPGFLVLTSGAGNIVEPLTGKVILPGKKGGLGDLSNTLAGPLLLWAEEGNRGTLSSWGRRRADGKALALFQTYDLSDPAKPKLLSNKNLLGGTAWPRMPVMERLAPELYALPVYAGQAYGKVTHCLHTDNAVFAAGNRLFVRTAGHLYCIGDPAVRYDGRKTNP